MWAARTFTAEALRLTGHHNTVAWNAVTILETMLTGWAFHLVLHSSKTRLFLRLAAAVFLTAGITEKIKAYPLSNIADS